MFKEGGDVVVTGKLDEAGVFQATDILTKCASKYQAEEHAKRLETK
jgi:cytochrome c-type biogenesis protein CcmE